MKARDLGILFDGNPGKFNAITDVAGVLVGHSTIIEGEGKLLVGKGPIRTGVTAIFPCSEKTNEVLAGFFSYNGNGEMTGTHWIEETGRLRGPICITNTHSVGIARDTIIEWSVKNKLLKRQFSWSLPVVAETYDGTLNDINGFHVKQKHVFEALESAKTGDIEEGNVGGGTGMVCHQFKGGIGTSSRILTEDKGGYTVGVIVQANYGLREHLTISGVPIGKEMKEELLPEIQIDKAHKEKPDDAGSIIVIVATDAPLIPYQLKRIAKRVTAGLARVGGYGSNSSGDIFLAFSTAKKLKTEEIPTMNLINFEVLDDRYVTPLFKTTAEATEEAIINAIINAETMQGINNNTIFSIPHDRLREILKKYNRLDEDRFR